LEKSFINFHIIPQRVFSGIYKPFDEADYVVLGVPYDGTSTYRAGSRFAPQAIREASLNIETYSLRTGLDVEDLKICDLGDLDIAEGLMETLQRLERVLGNVISAKKLPVILGGEHSLTLGAVKAFGTDVAVLDFDAHMDLRDEYMQTRLSHTTFMRRLAELIGSERIIEVGVRALCKADLEYANKTGLTYITAHELHHVSTEKVIQTIRDKLANFNKIYLTVDIDVLDPSVAPAVGNPEPEGISTHMLLDLLQGVCDKRFCGFDLVEVSPHYDSGETAAQAARIIFETLCFIEKSRQ
jgi:agmatinase